MSHCIHASNGTFNTTYMHHANISRIPTGEVKVPVARIPTGDVFNPYSMSDVGVRGC